MKPFINYGKWQIASVFSMRNVLLIIVLFMLIGLRNSFNIQLAEVNNELSELFLRSFGGVFTENHSIMNGLNWLLPFLLFYFLIGNSLIGDITKYGELLLIKIGSRTIWWVSSIAALFFCCVLYTIVGFIVVYIVGAFSFPLTYGSENYLIVVMFFLMVLALFVISLVQMVLTLITKQPFYGYIGSSLLLIVAWLIPNISQLLVKWVPGTHSMIARHIVFDASLGLTYTFTFIYSLMLILLLFSLGLFLAARLEILEKKSL